MRRRCAIRICFRPAAVDVLCVLYNITSTESIEIDRGTTIKTINIGRDAARKHEPEVLTESTEDDCCYNQDGCVEGGGKIARMDNNLSIKK